MSTNRPVVRIRRFRMDEDRKGEHQNVDDHLLFVPSDSSIVLMVAYQEGEDSHLRELSSETGIDGFLRPYRLDGVPSEGKIDDLRAKGVMVRFTT